MRDWRCIRLERYDWRLACRYCSECDTPEEDCGAPIEKHMDKWQAVTAGLIICPWFKPLVGKRKGKLVHMINNDNTPISSQNPVIVAELKKLGYRECTFGQWRAADMAQSAKKKEARWARSERGKG